MMDHVRLLVRFHLAGQRAGLLELCYSRSMHVCKVTMSDPTLVVRDGGHES